MIFYRDANRLFDAIDEYDLLDHGGAQRLPASNKAVPHSQIAVDRAGYGSFRPPGDCSACRTTCFGKLVGAIE